MDVFSEIVEKIIIEQEAIIGPVAIEQAQKVRGLKVDLGKHEFSFEGDKKKILEELVRNYEHLFGKASVLVCKDAVKGIIDQVPQGQVPELLQ